MPSFVPGRLEYLNYFSLREPLVYFGCVCVCVCVDKVGENILFLIPRIKGFLDPDTCRREARGGFRCQGGPFLEQSSVFHVLVWQCQGKPIVNLAPLQVWQLSPGFLEAPKKCEDQGILIV